MIVDEAVHVGVDPASGPDKVVVNVKVPTLSLPTVEEVSKAIDAMYKSQLLWGTNPPHTTPDGRYVLSSRWTQQQTQHWIRMRARLHEVLGKDAQTRHLQQEYNRIEALLQRGHYRPIGKRRLAGHT